MLIPLVKEVCQKFTTPVISPEMGSMSRSTHQLAHLPNNESYVRPDFSRHEASRRLEA